MDTIWAKRPLDILVNNAAGQILAQTHKLSTARHRRGAGHRAARLGLLHRGGRPALDRRRRARQGGDVDPHRLVAEGAPFTVPSAMAKAGVLAMTKSLAVEWGPKGIRTCAIVPGPFPTEGAWSRLMPKERGGNEELVKTDPAAPRRRARANWPTSRPFW